ncbi:MAG TPA: sensor domain-containing diguanylate cyclase [Arenimonas sp.]|nr:sensor domain-containing diguanylate cyclase [Arenimonas sp.]
MRSRHFRLWLYIGALLLLTLTVIAAGGGPMPWPPTELLLGLGLLQLVVWHYGFPLPVLGMQSMERVPQVAALCLLPYPQAAVVMALPALVWPFINRHYRQNSWLVGCQRALHNVCMIVLMAYAGGLAYRVSGGSVPLAALDSGSLAPLLAMAIALQLVNNVLIIALYAFDGRDYRRLLNPGFMFWEMVFIPFGVLLALIHHSGERDILLLFLLLVLLTVVSLHALGESRQQMQQRLQALDAAIGGQRPAGNRLDAILEALFNQVQGLFPARVVFIALHDPQQGDFDVRIECVDGQRRPASRRPCQEGLAGEVLARGEPVLIDSWAQAPATLRQRAVLDAEERPGSVLMVPLRWQERTLGVLSVQHGEPRFYSRADKHTLLTLADDSAVLIADALAFEDLERLRQSLEESVEQRTRALQDSLAANDALLVELKSKSALLERQSREDTLTGLANRRHFDERLQLEVQRAGRYGESFALVLIDLDHFKRVNDRYGHAGGDNVLRLLAHTMRRHARRTDLQARIGGEEFAWLLPGQDAAGASKAAELLRAAVAAQDCSAIDPQLVVTLSAGIAGWHPGCDADTMLRRADAALYQSKASGRDRVSVAVATD